MTEIPDLTEVVGRLVTALDRAGIEYAVGGALALALWGEPRATKDIDIAIYAGHSDLEHLFDLFEAAGGIVERDICRWRLKTSGYFEFEIDELRVDVFLPDFPLYEWARPRRVRVPLAGCEVMFWSAEDLILFKLLFFREKDKLDIMTILDLQRNSLDLEYLRRGLAEILRDEERSQWFDSTLTRGAQEA